MIKHYLKLISIIILLVTLLCNCDSNKSKIDDGKPNVILFLIDDLGWKDVGYMGSSYYETPNIDKLAKQGMRFTNAYANAPNCAPSRASLLTGKYSPRHNIYTVGTSERGHSKLRKIIPIENNKTLDLGHITIAEILKENGYTSTSIGKWHLGNPTNNGPISQGFDYNIAGTHAGHPKSYFSPYKNKFLIDSHDGEHLPERLTNEAIKFIDVNKEDPFFLYLPYYSVHTPIQAKENLVSKYKTKESNEFHNNPKYAAMIESVDDGIGKILTHIENLDLEKETIVIFFSDNGGLGKVTSMHPLRGSKGMLYEGGIRVPMVVKWKNKIEGNSVCETNVIGTDFLPTILELVGIKNQQQKLDGKSLVPLLYDDGKFERDAIYWHFPAYLEGKSALGARDKQFRTRPGGAIRMGDWKLIEYFEDSSLELYHLKDDISETNNLAKDNPAETTYLYNKLIEWRNSVSAPTPSEPNPQYSRPN